MEDKVKDAVIAALKDTQVSNAIKQSVQEAMQEKLQVSIPDVVKGAIQGAQQGAKQAEYDPYRTTIHFLGGLIAFCLAVIVGIFNALPDPPVTNYSLEYQMMGRVLAWISIAALVATVCSAIAQYCKHLYRIKQHAIESSPKIPKWRLLVLMGIPIGFGLIAVIFCVGTGLAILNDNAEPVGTADAICKLLDF